jgi:hypothetical protein
MGCAGRVPIALLIVAADLAGVSGSRQLQHWVTVSGQTDPHGM